MPVREERLLKNIKSGNLFGYVQCLIEILENLREFFAMFPPIFMNINVGRGDIGPIMKEIPKKEGLLTSTQQNANF